MIKITDKYIKIDSKNFGTVGINILINSQQFYQALLNPIAKDHFKEENPFFKTYYKTFGVFDWIFLKFECKIGEQTFYYIKGLIPNLNTELNQDLYDIRYFFLTNNNSVLRINKKPSKSDIFKIYLSFDHWYGEISQYYETLASCGENLSSQIEENDFYQFFNVDVNVKTKSFYFPFKEYTIDDIVIPKNEMISLTENKFDLNYLFIADSSSPLTLEGTEIAFGYPIDSNGENKVFKIPFNTLSPSLENFSLKIDNYNNFYNGSKKGLLNWRVSVETTRNTVDSSTETFLWMENPTLSLSVGVNGKVEGYKNIPVSININYPEIKIETYTIKKDTGSSNSANFNFPNYLKQYNKNGKLWNGIGDIYYKFLATNDITSFFLVKKELYDKFVDYDKYGDTIETFYGEDFSGSVKVSDIIFLQNDKIYEVEMSNACYTEKVQKLFLPENSVPYHINSLSKYYYLSFSNYESLKTFTLADLRPDLLDISYYAFSIKDNLSNKIIKQKETVYTGDLNLTIDFLPVGDYTLYAEVKNNLGVKINQELSFKIDNNQKIFNKKPAISLLEDTGIYLNWNQIPFLQAYFTKGNLTEKDFYYNYPVEKDEENLEKSYNSKSLHIPSGEKLQFNLMGQKCDYLVSCN